jgi:hypothetical protein
MPAFPGSNHVIIGIITGFGDYIEFPDRFIGKLPDFFDGINIPALGEGQQANQ